MNVDGYNREYNIARNKAVTGCFAMFALFFGITCLPFFFEGSKDLMITGYLYPLLFGLEFLTIVPLYYLYFYKREGMGRGDFRFGIFIILFLCILLIQFLLPFVTAGYQTENWSASQMRLDEHVFWLNAIVMILLVPVYEEMVFRGCLFSVFKYWLGNNNYAAAVAVSVVFSACHLQYIDWRSFLTLFLVSLMLVIGRIKTGGILMPIILHALMNAVVIGIQYVSFLQYFGGA